MTEQRILEFLRSHPGAPLRVAVGYCSVWGLAWLAQHTQDRPVELLIGDTRKRNFENAPLEERRAAIEFLSRNDVRVCNWYKKHEGASQAHLKAWVIRTSKGLFVLTGSANLTKKGLRHNAEAMGEYTGADARRTANQVDALFAKSWDAKERITGYLQATASPARRAPRSRTARTPHPRSQTSRPRSPQHSTRPRAQASTRRQVNPSKRNGCLTTLLGTVSVIVAIGICVSLIAWAIT